MLSYTKIVGSKGEVVIPKDIRNQQGLKPNSKVEVLSINNGILLIPLNKKLSEFRGLFGKKGINNIRKLDILTHELMYRL